MGRHEAARMRYHHQNLSYDRYPLWRHGRAWWGALEWEWTVFDYSRGHVMEAREIRILSTFAARIAARALEEAAALDPAKMDNWPDALLEQAARCRPSTCRSESMTSPLEQVREALLAGKTALSWYIMQFGGIHGNGCPEDDTCDCGLVAMTNSAMRRLDEAPAILDAAIAQGPAEPRNGPDLPPDASWERAARYWKDNYDAAIAREAEEERGMLQLIDECDRANDALQETHIALGGNGEWSAKPGQTCVAGETGDLAIDIPVLAAEVIAREAELLEQRDEARSFGEEAARKYNELLAGEVLRCAFCDVEYPQGTPPTQHEALTAHVMECEKHPLRAKLDRLAQAARDKLSASLSVDEARLLMVAVNGSAMTSGGNPGQDLHERCDAMKRADDALRAALGEGEDRPRAHRGSVP